MPPRYYFAFGLRIESELRLWGPAETEAGPAEIAVCRGVLTRWQGLRRRPGEILLGLGQLATFACREGRCITVDACPGADETLLSAYILGVCMAALLYQRGQLLLHGSCVVHNGRGLLLAGPSGAGKSTLARAFMAQGWRLATDDLSCVVMDGTPACRRPAGRRCCGRMRRRAGAFPAFHCPGKSGASACWWTRPPRR